MSVFKRLLLPIKRALLALTFSSVIYNAALADSAQEYVVRAGLVVNFARFTTWPSKVEAATGKNITLCVIGNAEVEEAFTALNGKAVAEKTLQIRYLTRFNNLGDCQLLYVSDIDKSKLLLLLNDIKASPILTLGEDEFFVNNGGMVGLQISNGKVSMSINLNATKKANLNISARVLKLATVIQ